jgi:hypothetical protein
MIPVFIAVAVLAAIGKEARGQHLSRGGTPEGEREHVLDLRRSAKPAKVEHREPAS